jgi:hypothetical protein
MINNNVIKVMNINTFLRSHYYMKIKGLRKRKIILMVQRLHNVANNKR